LASGSGPARLFSIDGWPGVAARTALDLISASATAGAITSERYRRAQGSVAPGGDEARNPVGDRRDRNPEGVGNLGCRLPGEPHGEDGVVGGIEL
jgi:hypothetical protein